MALPRIRTTLALALAALGLALGRVDAATAPDAASAPPPAPAAAAADPDVELAALHAQVDGAVRALRFGVLDAEADALRASRARLADGRWKLSMLFGEIDEAMSHVLVDPADGEALERAATAYAREHPASANAALFLVRVHLGKAWIARGLGEWSAVPADGQRRFRDSVAQARRILDESRAIRLSNPMWLVDRIGVASLAGESYAVVDALLRESFAREPRFHVAAYAALAARRPSRGGSTAAMMAFINDAGRASAGARAEGLYARLVVVAEGDYAGIEDDPALDWPAMTSAFEAILRTWPAPRNARRFLLMACHHGDRAEARALLRLAPPAGPGLERCLAWARAEESKPASP